MLALNPYFYFCSQVHIAVVMNHMRKSQALHSLPNKCYLVHKQEKCLFQQALAELWNSSEQNHTAVGLYISITLDVSFLSPPNCFYWRQWQLSISDPKHAGLQGAAASSQSIIALIWMESAMMMQLRFIFQHKTSAQNHQECQPHTVRTQRLVGRSPGSLSYNFCC